MTDSSTDLSAEQREALLDALQDRLAARAADGGIRPRDPAEPAPASYSQRRHWLLDRLQPGNAAYNVPLAARIRGRLDVAALAAALAAVVERHEVLRTTLHELDGEPVQRVWPPPATPLAIADPAGSADLTGWLERVAYAPFDLSAGPLLRAELLREAPDRHVLVLVAHHSVMDGWSLGLLLRELDAHYTAAREHRPADVPVLRVQYADFAGWQRNRPAEDVRADLDYWQRQLAGAPAVLDLPTDDVADPTGSTGGGLVRLELDAPVGQGIRELCGRTGTTPFMVLLAAVSDVLGRLAGSEHVVLGAPVVGRPRPEVEALIGDFLNTLPLRVDRSGEGLHFRALLERVRRVTVDGYAHAALPFEQLVEAVQPERSTTVSPIFQVLVNHTETVPLADRLGDAELDFLDLTDPPSKFPLTLYLREEEDAAAGSGRFRLDAVFQTARYSRQRIALLLRQVARLLTQVLADPERPLARCSLVLPGDPLPDPAQPLPARPQPSVAELVGEHVAGTPQAPALEWGDLALDYAELDARVARIRDVLARTAGGSPVVAVTGGRSAGTAAAMLAVLTGGGVLLALDPQLPRLRRQAMLTEAGADRLVVVGEVAQQVGTESLTVVRVSPDGAEVDVEPAAAPDPGRRVPELVRDPGAGYVFFTSGTTGTPKAVVGSRHGLAHFLRWQRDTFGIGPGDRCAHLTGLSFDVVLRDLLLAPVSGATLVVPAGEDDLAPDRIAGWLAAHRVTVVHAVPTLTEAWLAETPDGAAAPGVRLTFAAGEPLTGDTAARWRSAGGGRVVNLYGPTETTLAKLAFEVPERPAAGVQPIGRPMPGAQALVQTRAGMLCGVGEVGEIVLRTPYRSLGYANLPDTPGWRPNPATGDPGDILYATGDLGRFRPDGSLDILGRADRQVKIRGVRVEPDEVAAVAARHPAVTRAAVAAVRDGTGPPVLAAWLVAPGATAGTPSQLRGYLGKRLPAAAVPAVITIVDDIPLTANGKTDWAALPKAVPDAAAARYVAPRTELERTVAGVFATLLRRDRVGVHDGFFDLGGHSLLAMQLVSRLAPATGVTLPLQVVFEAPTVAGLAAAVEQRRATGEGVAR